MGDNVEIGEAALGICFPLKAHSSYPMHPVPHLSLTLFKERIRPSSKNKQEFIQKNVKKNKKRRRMVENPTTALFLIE